MNFTILNITGDYSGVDPTNWDASATVDYVNRFGGVERTNLIFHCFGSRHSVYSFIDESAMWERQELLAKRLHAFQAQFSGK